MECGKDLSDYADVGYDGPQNRDDQRCSWFMPWETLCITCEEKRNGGER